MHIEQEVDTLRCGWNPRHEFRPFQVTHPVTHFNNNTQPSD